MFWTMRLYLALERIHTIFLLHARSPLMEEVSQSRMNGFPTLSGKLRISKASVSKSLAPITRGRGPGVAQ